MTEGGRECGKKKKECFPARPKSIFVLGFFSASLAGALDDLFYEIATFI